MYTDTYDLLHLHNISRKDECSMLRAGISEDDVLLIKKYIKRCKTSNPKRLLKNTHPLIMHNSICALIMLESRIYCKIPIHARCVAFLEKSTLPADIKNNILKYIIHDVKYLLHHMNNKKNIQIENLC